MAVLVVINAFYVICVHDGNRSIFLHSTRTEILYGICEDPFVKIMGLPKNVWMMRKNRLTTIMVDHLKGSSSYIVSRLDAFKRKSILHFCCLGDFG